MPKDDKLNQGSDKVDSQAFEPHGSGPRPGGGRMPAAPLAQDIQRHIGRQLKAAYGDVLSEPIPDRFRLLLEELDRKARPKDEVPRGSGEGQ